MKKLFFIGLLAFSGITLGCPLNFQSDVVVNGQGTAVLISLDNKTNDNLTWDQIQWHKKQPPVSKVHVINYGANITLEPTHDPDGTNYWIFYVLENGVFVRKTLLTMHACMSGLNPDEKFLK